MKAIKDCEWEVKSINKYTIGWIWVAFTSDDSGIDNSLYMDTDGKPLSTRRQVKYNWERFAKLNKIKKWRYV